MMRRRSGEDNNYGDNVIMIRTKMNIGAKMRMSNDDSDDDNNDDDGDYDDNNNIDNKNNIDICDDILE